MKTLKEWLQMQKNAMLDNLEKEREQKSIKRKIKQVKPAKGGKKVALKGILALGGNSQVLTSYWNFG